MAGCGWRPAYNPWGDAMTSVLVVYATRHGATKGIAERIGTVLANEGVVCTVASAEESPDPSNADACIVGSGVYMGSWLGEGTDYLARHVSSLSRIPVWLFSSGPLPGSSKSTEGADALADALGPADGPGSGGRKKVQALSDQIHPRDHKVFLGAYDPTDPPRSIPERVLRMLPASKNILPVGDFREWDVIEAWARGIAGELVAKPVAAKETIAAPA